MTQPNSITIDAATLQACLRRIGRLAGRVCGAGIWELGTDQLSLEWSGCFELLPATGNASARVRVDGTNMRGLARIKLGKGSVHVRVENGHLSLDTLSMPCAPVTAIAQSVLPAFATQRDLVLAMHRHSRADLLAAGHATELGRIEERTEKSVERAAKALSWLGISQYEVERWVQAHLRSIAEGGVGYFPSRPAPPAPRLVVVDEHDQLQLLPRKDR